MNKYLISLMVYVLITCFLSGEEVVLNYENLGSNEICNMLIEKEKWGDSAGLILARYFNLLKLNRDENSVLLKKNNVLAANDCVDYLSSWVMMHSTIDGDTRKQYLNTFREYKQALVKTGKLENVNENNKAPVPSAVGGLKPLEPGRREEIKKYIVKCIALLKGRDIDAIINHMYLNEFKLSNDNKDKFTRYLTEKEADRLTKGLSLAMESIDDWRCEPGRIYIVVSQTATSEIKTFEFVDKAGNISLHSTSNERWVTQEPNSVPNHK